MGGTIQRALNDKYVSKPYPKLSTRVYNYTKMIASNPCGLSYVVVDLTINLTSQDSENNLGMVIIMQA